jgi:1-phosphofructokinase family hexose kinase
VIPLVVSLNPSVDAEWRVEGICPEEKNELLGERRWPGGKGVNVARWLQWLGVPPRLFLPLGGITGGELAAGLRAEKRSFFRFPLRQPTRVNVIVTPEHGPQLRFNPTWPRVNRSESRKLLAATLTRAVRHDPVVVSGTLTFGAPADLYARLVRGVVAAGRRVFLDCDREPFALAAKERPFLVKPNEFELTQWAGKSLRSRAALRRTARELSTVTGGWVLLSRGEHGAWLIHAGQGVELAARPPHVTPRNRVGAGDAMLAAAVRSVTAGDKPSDWLRHAVATGTAATQVPPGKLPPHRLAHELFAAIRVEALSD